MNNQEVRNSRGEREKQRTSWRRRRQQQTNLFDVRLVCIKVTIVLESFRLWQNQFCWPNITRIFFRITISVTWIEM